MAKALIRDLPIGPFSTRGKVVLEDDQPTYFGVPTRLTGESVTPGEVNPELTVRARHTTGYDEDGNAEFTWSVVVQGRAIIWSDRQETDDRTGSTSVTASAVLLYDGDIPVTESATVTQDDTILWKVTSVETFPDRLEFELWRATHG